MQSHLSVSRALLQASRAIRSSTLDLSTTSGSSTPSSPGTGSPSSHSDNEGSWAARNGVRRRQSTASVVQPHEGHPKPLSAARSIQRSRFNEVVHRRATTSASASSGRSTLLKPSPVDNQAPSRQHTSSDNANHMGARFNADAGPVDTQERVTRLRHFMEKAGVNAYYVPTEDAHSSEYITPGDARRFHITGFSGSAGTAIILPKSAHLFTDGRYFNQAAKQLDPQVWELMKSGVEGVPTWKELLTNRAKELKSAGESPLRVGVDPTLIAASDSARLTELLAPFDGELVPLEDNLVDMVWGDQRPTRPTSPVFRLKDNFAGKSAADKIEELRQVLVARDPAVAGTLVSALDDVAWLFNLRGSDIAFNPVFFSYAWIGAKEGEVTLFVDDAQIRADPAVSDYLTNEIKVSLKPYDAVWSALEEAGKTAKEAETKVVISSRASLAVEKSLGGPDNVELTQSLVSDLKAIKNSTEIEGFRKCHIRDGAALVRYFAWLEESLNHGMETTEYEGSTKLEEFRKNTGGELFKGLSFETISSTGANAAVIHYAPDPESSKIIDKNEVYLCDSGAQYLDGTTDVTRTLHFGTPTDEQIQAFTRVLQGHISIDTLVFPKGTTGYLLDAFARRALWQDGLDYRHGTGHGVGFFCNVHEGPQGIGTRIAYNDVPLKEGMTLSNEPGYYKDDSFGIRIESVVVVKKVNTKHNFGDKDFLGFENLTMCPISTNLIDQSLLTSFEKGWVNDYHAEVLEKIVPVLESVNDVRALAWLKKECKSL